MRKNLLILLVAILTINAGAQTTIAIRGNSYITSEDRTGVRLTRNGTIEQWTSTNAEISTFFKVYAAGELNLAIKAKSGGESSKVKVTVGETSVMVTLNTTEYQTINVGKFQLKDSGYVQIKLQGVTKTGETFGTVEGYEVSGTATAKGISDCGNFEAYWANRGPSVHLKYQLPKDTQTEYFYNEVTVTKGNDVIGSYYMACGFGEGYFGMQVNSATERRILFSVWSPFETQDPKQIPEADRIVMLEQGEGVHIGEFGNEGSGGQSYLKYNWITGNTYKFLMQIRPDGKGNTIYTARFYAPEKGKWQLIASFRRPKTNTYYTNAHSFLENFSPAQGHLTRRVEFGNQWARSKDGVWSEVTSAVFTFDATANAGARKDYAGGVENNTFFLKNCGFFNESTPYRSVFERKPTNNKPQTDL